MATKVEKFLKNGISVPVNVVARDGKSSPGIIFIQNWNKRQRLNRALKFLGIGWGLAILSIFLPVAHFFLFPAFFLGTPIVTVYALRQQSAVLGGESICPQCQKALPLVGGAEVWPLEDLCSLCQTHVTVEKRMEIKTE